MDNTAPAPMPASNCSLGGSQVPLSSYVDRDRMTENADNLTTHPPGDNHHHHHHHHPNKLLTVHQ
jgi:hypothetical protein